MNCKKNLIIISSHPIQYNAPFFELLAQHPEIDLLVIYTLGEKALTNNYDPDFGRKIEWDIPLLKGYNFHFTRNVSKKPGSVHFRGIITPDLIQEVMIFKPDFIWVWGWAFHGHLEIMRFFKGKIPIWFRGDSTLIDESSSFSLRKVIRRLVLVWVYKHVDRVFSVGTNNSLYFIKHKIPENKIILAPHSIDNQRFQNTINNSSKEIELLKNSLGLRESDYILLFAGKLEDKKNPSFFLEVCKKLKNSGMTGVMVGNGKLELELRSKGENIIFLNFQNQTIMPLIYSIADIFVLPSLGPNETWGLAINEAMACGVPVAASVKCGGAIDLITLDNGFVFNPLDGTDSFINKLTKFKAKPIIDIKHAFVKKFNYQRIVDAVINELN